MKGVNNETLLAWSDYEVIQARAVLLRAEERNRILLEKVKAERDEGEQKACAKEHLEKLGVPLIVYGAAASLEELLVMVTDTKVFLRKCGVAEEELEP